MRWMVLGLMVAATPATAADQFDLICKYGKTPVRYRIDLSQHVACEAQCERLWKLGAVTAGEIRLKDTVANYPDEYPRQTITINRQTGELRHWNGSATGNTEERASCESAAFSGFPTGKF